jgi:hypothetical protein
MGDLNNVFVCTTILYDLELCYHAVVLQRGHAEQIEQIVKGGSIKTWQSKILV